MLEYEESLKIYRDNINVIETAKEEGREEGGLKKAIEIAKKMLHRKDSIEDIVDITGLTVEQIKTL